MYYDEKQPLIVQTDGSLIVETNHKEFVIIQPMLSQFAELKTCPENIHTYRITPLSVWYAASQGILASEIISFLSAHSKLPLPNKVKTTIETYFERYKMLKLVRNEQQRLVLTCEDSKVLKKLSTFTDIQKCIGRVESETSWIIKDDTRGVLKQKCLDVGYPILDLAGYSKGKKLPMFFRSSVTLRPYQKEAVQAFHRSGNNDGGSGIIVLPCGSGKTIVGLGVMTEIQEETIILTPNETSMLQWKRELLTKTSLSENDIGFYHAKQKEVKPITIATYQILSYRNRVSKELAHLPLFTQRNWGLIIYDEVHLLPAPIFRMTANIQGKKRLGLTATLVREDGKADDVYSLIGPKKYEASWKGLESNGWIAEAFCKEIKVQFSESDTLSYMQSRSQTQYRIAAENPKKFAAIKKILNLHSKRQILIIGHYVNQLEKVAKQLDVPMITGKTPHKEREYYYDQFKNGTISTLAVSKVANLAVDLPDAEIAIQISGTFGSRQEEAQRIGRLLRPTKDNNKVFFYSIITKDSKEETYSENRQRFMIEQGYEYEVEEWGS